MNPKRRYQEYLASDHWAAMKFFKAQMDVVQCVACLATDDIDLHHMVYTNPLEDAQLEDTCWLCHYCHGLFHHKAGTVLKGVPRHLLIAETVRVILTYNPIDPPCDQELLLGRRTLNSLGVNPDHYEATLKFTKKAV